MVPETPACGTKINAYGEIFTWSPEHPTTKELQPLLHSYDEIAGNAYNRSLEISDQQQARLKYKNGADAAKWPSPKPDVFQVVKDNAATDTTCGQFWEHVNAVPEWVDWDQLARAQDVFYRYALANMLGLAYQSLFVGLAAARPVEVLLRTGGFSPAIARQRTIETAQWILEITKDIDSIKPGGEGWASTVRVRLLHSAVRSRIAKMAEAKPEYYDVENWGIPINDFDSAVTICGFSSAPIWSGLPRQKLHMHEQEIVDTIAFWRYIAYLIGAPERFFATPQRAKLLQESMLYYEIHPNDNSRVLARNLLESFESAPPFYLPTGIITVTARGLAGDELCDKLEVPKSNILWKGVWASSVNLYRAIAYVSRSVTWLDQTHINLMKNATWRIVVEGRHGLDGQKTKFPFKYKPHYDITKAE